MRKIPLLFFCFLCNVLCNAQTSHAGKVIDENGRKMLSLLSHILDLLLTIYPLKKLPGKW
jgi:hypothetical protein